ncbi:OmpA family protein [Robiginitomaculum antarcticum]|uniref:OmpA family protein n=1 Tax=Robiginitomaculum antarcticum TaxID=437507 RepID=UPI00037612F3|nr:outer membrane beta-barrel protein [Robiginitomaculum antarcticum]
MKKSLLAAAALAALMAAPSVASAQDTGWYLRGNVGAGVFDEATFTGDLVGEVQGEANLAPSIGLGYEFGNNWRLELDGTYIYNDLGAISSIPSTSADFRTYSAMLNAIYDFNDFGRWEPYVGAGIGFVRGHLSAQTSDFPSAIPFGPGTGAVNVTNAACSPICEFSDNDSGIGYQLIAGLGYDITENLTWDTHYKYMGLTDLDFNGIRRAPGGGAGAEISTQMEDVGAHMLMTGFRYSFGAAPVVMTPVADYRCWDGNMVFNASQCSVQPPATKICADGSEILASDRCPVTTYTCWDGLTVVEDLALCPAPPLPPVVVDSFCDQGDTQFVVYFEWDKSRLTNEAAAVVDQASSIAQACGISGVVLEGHTDTSGSASYNMGLSSRRANTVKSALVSRGFQSTNITTQAKGESEVAVATGDGVREPLNRRTEVVIRLIPGSDTGMIIQ